MHMQDNATLCVYDYTLAHVHVRNRWGEGGGGGGDSRTVAAPKELPTWYTQQCSLVHFQPAQAGGGGQVRHVRVVAVALLGNV